MENLLSVTRPLILQDVRPNPVANVSVEQDQSGVDALRHCLARLKDQPPNLSEQCGWVGCDHARAIDIDGSEEVALAVSHGPTMDSDGLIRVINRARAWANP